MSIVLYFVLCFGFSVFIQAIPVGQFLNVLDKSLLYQLTHPTRNVNSVRFLIEDLRAYKDNLQRITKRIGMGRGFLMEHAKNLSLSDSPVFLKSVNDYEKLRSSFNLTEAQLADIRILISQIGFGWDEFLKVANCSECQTDVPQLPFFIIDKAGNNIVHYLRKPSSNITSKLFTDLSNYYYALGKLLKLIKSNQEGIYEKCRSIYDQDKPVFLRRYLNFGKMKNHFQMDDVQATSFKRWVSKILFRWKIFMGFYETNKNITDKANFNNFNELVNLDNELKDIMSNPIPPKLTKLMDLLDSFFLTVGLILRKNYRFREEIISHVKETYRSGPPLFLQKYINFRHLKESFKLNEESFYRLRKKIYDIKNRWERLNILENVAANTISSTVRNYLDMERNKTSTSAFIYTTSTAFC